MNLKWPMVPGNGWIPWYLILWRLPWAPLIYGGMAITFVARLIACGPADARSWWRSAT